MLQEYNKILYGGNTITDITKRFTIKTLDKKYKRRVYFDHIIEGWISPENLAYDFYGSCDEVWLILTINNVVDPFNDWLLSHNEIMNRINVIWGGKAKEIHHYEKDGICYQNMVPGAYPVTNHDYEIDKNEKKRKVKIVYPELVTEIKAEFKRFLAL